MTTITLINPWSKSVVHKDMSDITQQQLDAYAQVMSDESREAVRDCDTPSEWLAAWAEMVGPEEAGRVILGS